LDGGDEGGSVVGGEAGAQDQGAVLVPVPGQGSAGGEVFGWGVAAPYRPHHGLHVAGGARQGHVQQHLFRGLRVRDRGVPQLGLAGGDVGGDPGQGRGIGAGDAGDRPNLRVGDPPGGERFGDAGQVLQGVGDAEVFGGGAPVHPGPPGQPMRAGADPVPAPATSGVELGQQLQEPALRSSDVPGQPQQLRLQRWS
jgi:hypothetical protein